MGTVPAGREEIAALVGLVTEYAPLEVVVGLPRSLAGGEGPAAAAVRARTARLVAALRAEAPEVAVRLIDERFTTVTAARQLRDRGVRGRRQRAIIDATAATALLQHALEAEGNASELPGELVSGPDHPGKDAAAEGD